MSCFNTIDYFNEEHFDFIRNSKLVLGSYNLTGSSYKLSQVDLTQWKVFYIGVVKYHFNMSNTGEFLNEHVMTK